MSQSAFKSTSNFKRSALRILIGNKVNCNGRDDIWIISYAEDY